MKTIKKVFIPGAGLMGKNIAYVFASIPDVTIKLYDIFDVDVAAGLRVSCKEFLEKGIISEEAFEERLSRISFTKDLADAKDADLVVEAVFESMELKQETFKKLEAICSADCIFCTNTSVMSPSAISKDLKYRGRFAGTHFWNPGHMIPLVEVVKTDATTDETAESIMAFMTAAGKKPVLCKKDVPGFIANRMQHALWREAISIVEHGIADAETVDIAVKNSFGLRLPQLGPLENSDLVDSGLTLSIHKYVLQYLEDSHEPSPLLEKMVEEGKMGFKTNEGFMKWNEESKAAVRTGLNNYLSKMLYNK